MRRQDVRRAKTAQGLARVRHRRAALRARDVALRDRPGTQLGGGPGGPRVRGPDLSGTAHRPSAEPRSEESREVACGVRRVLSDGSGLDSATRLNLIRLSSSGAFRRSIHGLAPLAGGQVATFDEQAIGRVGSSKAKGTYRAQVTVRDQAGNTVNVCTAAFTWSALA